MHILKGFHMRICDIYIGWGGEQNTLYKGVETFPYQTRLKALRGSPKGKAQRVQYLLAVGVGLGHYRIRRIIFVVLIYFLPYFSLLARSNEE